VNWQSATPAEIRERINAAKRTGRGVTVSPAWLERMLDERMLLARVASDKPDFFNPLEAMAAIMVRDAVLQEHAR
jgi:hypothetical protein